MGPHVRLGHGTDPGLEILFGLGLGMDEHQIADRADTSPVEGPVREIHAGKAEILFRQTPEAPVIEVVGPCVVATGDPVTTVATSLLEYLCSAMTAGVVVGAQRSLLRADDDHGIAIDLDGHVVSRFGQIQNRTGKSP